MRTPGFTADSSLYKTSHQYRTGDTGAVQARRGGVALQQDDDEVYAISGGSDGGTLQGSCCGKRCPKMCICEGGVGKCVASPASAATAPDEYLMAAESVMMASIDLCHADVAVDGGVATAICDPAKNQCGCWATTHDAGCFACHGPVASGYAPDVYLKA